MMKVTRVELSRVGFNVGSCEASRFYSNSNRTISIRFESYGPIRNFRISRTCRRSQFNKKLQRCVVVIEIYFMFVLCLCSKSIHTR